MKNAPTMIHPVTKITLYEDMEFTRVTADSECQEQRQVQQVCMDPGQPPAVPGQPPAVPGQLPAVGGQPPAVGGQAPEIAEPPTKKPRKDKPPPKPKGPTPKQKVVFAKRYVDKVQGPASQLKALLQKSEAVCDTIPKYISEHARSVCEDALKEAGRSCFLLRTLLRWLFQLCCA